MEKSVAKFTLLALPLFALTACQDYEPFTEAEVHATMAAREFAHNFEARYGKIDPNHDWGFHSLEPYTSVIDTRANVDVNLNQWADKYEMVPGYPFINNKYRVQTGTNQPVHEFDNTSYNHSEYKLPAGDVTDYEISWVSEWFRTHRDDDPEFIAAKVSMNISEFFIQNVSKDHDQISYPNGDNKNTISDIHGRYADRNSDYGMDFLVCQEAGGSLDDRYYTSDGWTDINNFNSGSSNFNPYPTSSNANYTWREIKLVTSGGTSNFACKVSDIDSDDKYVYDWVLVHLSWTETIDGTPYKRDGYYLAFDYSAHMTNGFEYPRDHYYSNWIVKITPAYYKPTPHTTRIMCEDLGNTFDFDFNDVVFDVAYERNTDNTIDAVITLQAAGGTMPIFVGTKTAGLEAHKLLGNRPSTTPINVSSVTSNPTTYRLKNVSTNPDDIKIYVDNNRDGKSYEIGSANRGNLAAHSGSNGYNDGDKLDVGNTGASAAPQKFAVPSSVRWMQETEQIETAYPYFENWVQDAGFLNDGKEWYHNDNMESSGKIWNVGAGFNGEEYSGGGSSSGDAYVPSHKLTLVVDNPEMGSAVFQVGEYYGQTVGSFKYGETVRVHAAPAQGMKFWRWKFRNTAETLSTEATLEFEYTRSMRDMGELVAYFLPENAPIPNN